MLLALKSEVNRGRNIKNSRQWEKAGGSYGAPFNQMPQLMAAAATPDTPRSGDTSRSTTPAKGGKHRDGGKGKDRPSVLQIRDAQDKSACIAHFIGGGASGRTAATRMW